MNVQSGAVYPDLQAALVAGEPRDLLVEVSGPPDAVRELQDRVRALDGHDLDDLPALKAQLAETQARARAEQLQTRRGRR